MRSHGVLLWRMLTLVGGLSSAGCWCNWGGGGSGCNFELDARTHVTAAEWCAGLWCKNEGRCALDATRAFVDPPEATRGACAACLRDALSTLTGDSCSTSGDDCDPPSCAAAFAACASPA